MVSVRRSCSGVAKETLESSRYRDSGDSENTGGELIAHGAGIDNRQTGKVQLFERDAHGRRQVRCINALALQTIGFAVHPDDQIDLSSVVSRPEVCIVHVQCTDNLLNHISFPRGPQLRVMKQRLCRSDPEELMEQAGIPDIDLRRLHLSLLQIGVPRLQLPHHEEIRQHIDIAACRRLMHREGSRHFRGVPDLSMIVSKHRPEAEQCRRCGSESRTGGHRVRETSE